MRVFNRLRRWGLVALLLVLGVSGCQPSKDSGTFKVGRVDTAVLLRDDPKYQSLSIDYMKENMALRQKYVEKAKAAGGGDAAREELAKVYQREQKALDDKWMGKTQDFLESTHSSIRQTAERIAKDKDIDVVLIDSREYPTVEWGGVDITPDFALSKTQGQSAGATPSAKGS